MKDGISLAGAAHAWNAFFHAPASPLPLALFRIAFGTILAIESLGLWHWASDLFDKRGVCRANTPGAVGWLFRLHTMSCVCLAAGFMTRVAATLVFLNFCFRSRRNWLVIQGGDNLAKFMSLLLVFSNAGGVLSLDHLLHLRSLGGASEVASQWPLKLMQIQVSIIYLRTASWKLRTAEWFDGSAVFHALNRNLHLRRAVSGSAARAVLAYAPVAAFLTWSTLLGEVFVGVFIWFGETRDVALVIAVLLHLGFELFLSIKQFQWLMLASLMLFLRAQDWLWLRALL